ncbi:MAG: AraC family transcriptional regulator [Treponema sp.]|nr:AraC family transcriptional regulator [Treponema sp.]
MKEAFHETKTHGSIEFPFIIYRGNIPEYIHSFPLHWHEEFEIIYVTDGTGTIQVLNKTYQCHPGDIIIIPPDYIHSIYQYKNEKMEYFNILFKFSLLEENRNSLCFRKYFVLFQENNMLHCIYNPSSSDLGRKITPYLLSLIENRKASYTGYELMIKSCLFGVLYYLKDYLIPTTGKYLILENRITRLKPIIAYIQEHYAESISIEKAASVSNISASHFMKTFKDIIGKTFTQYLNCFRLETAVRELMETDKSVMEISEDCGFNNFSYFIRSFKRSFGKTPLEYRHSMSPENPV